MTVTVLAAVSMLAHFYLFILDTFYGFKVYFPNVFRNKQDAQLSQRDRAAGCVTVFAKSRILELGDNILRTL